MYVISVVNLGNCALYLEAQNQEKEFGSAFHQGYGFQHVGVLRGGAGFILEVQRLVPQWEHTGGFHNTGGQTEECFMEEVQFIHSFVLC